MPARPARFGTTGFWTPACGSYLSIEHAGALPAGPGGGLAGTVYGCDACTAVCPWNRQGENLALSEFNPVPELPDPGQIIALSAGGFERVFAGTPIRRIGLGRLRRNALAAIGRT